MNGISAGELDRRITFLHIGQTDDGLATVADAPMPDITRWAKKTDASDAERVRAAAEGIEVTCRFLVRWDAFTSSLNSAAILVCDDVEHAVTGIKETRGRRVGIEITAVARSNQP